MPIAIYGLQTRNQHIKRDAFDITSKIPILVYWLHFLKSKSCLKNEIPKS